MLLIFCFMFYGYKNILGLCLIIIIIFVDFFLSKVVSNNENKNKYLFLSILLSLSTLILFKYANFFSSVSLKFIELLAGKKLEKQLVSLTLLPGISFYTFQSISYMMDVYKKKILPEKSILNYSLFLGFFPQLVAGPIVNAAHFLPQIEKLKSIRLQDLYLKKAIYFFLLGFIKKSVIADNISVIVDQCFHIDFIHVLSSFSLFIGMLSYSIQIYMDFSGYSDMAIGLAYLFGIQLPENFRYPYLSSSITEFWRTWHITLSNWLRDYVYIPLGGSKKSNLDTYKNLFLTMVLGGLWHGANWNFIVWGGVHGILLCLERIVHKKSDIRPDSFLLRNIKIIFVFLLVSLIWILFRAENLEFALKYFQNLFLFKTGLELGYTKLNQFYLILGVMFLSQVMGKKFENKLKHFTEKDSGLLFYFFISILIIGSILLSGNAKPFIYFVF